jgi:magnesium transporter
MENQKPWIQLENLLENEQHEELRSYLDEMSSEDVVSTFSHIRAESSVDVFMQLAPAEAADIMEDLPNSLRDKILEDLPVKQAAAIIHEFRSDEQADIIHEMDDKEASAILQELSPAEAESIRRLILFDSDTAGGLMITEYLAFDEDKTVAEVTNNLREKSSEYTKYNLQYIYATRNGIFEGVLQTRDLLLSTSDTKLSQIVIRGAKTVQETSTYDELVGFFDRYDFYGVPVLNARNELVGVVLRRDLREEETDKANLELLEVQGIVGGEELRTMPILERSKRRLSWLSVNILLNIMAASVIAFYQDTLSSVIALAVFLPIVSDMSGCSGNQAVAVSLRELALGVVKPFEVMRVWWQEVWVGVVNGIVLGILLGTAAWIWKGNIYLGLVAGGALAINTIIAVSLGGTIPLILKQFKVDPALASGPLLTTITDMVGFFLTLSFANLAMNHLV